MYIYIFFVSRFIISGYEKVCKDAYTCHDRVFGEVAFLKEFSPKACQGKPKLSRENIRNLVQILVSRYY